MPHGRVSHSGVSPFSAGATHVPRNPMQSLERGGPMGQASPRDQVRASVEVRRVCGSPLPRPLRFLGCDACWLAGEYG